MKNLKFTFPGFMNFGVTDKGELVGDSNNSKDWRALNIILPTIQGEHWVIKSVNLDSVILESKGVIEE